MFEFLFALFGGAYWGGKLLEERSRISQGKARQKIYEGVTDKIVRLPAGDYKPPETRGEFWVMCESISDDLHYIFGDNWRTRLNFPLIPYYGSICNRINDRQMFTHPTQIAYHVWLSKKGYYGSAFLGGYNYKAFGDTNSPENQELVLRTLKTIEKNLQIAHPDIPLRLCKSTLPNQNHLLRWEYIPLSVGATPGERVW